MTSCAPLPKRRREERSDDRVMRLVLLARRVGLVVRLVLGSAPLSEQGARSRLDGSRVELSRRAGGVETSTARSARRRQRAARPRAHPLASRQRPMSGCAAIGLALGPTARCPERQPTQRPGGRQANLSARRDEPYDAVVAALLPAPLRKRCDGVIPALRAVLTPGLASLARRERPARLPVGRAAWPNRLHAEGSPPACQEDGHPRSRLAGIARRYRAPASHVSSHVSSGRANRPPGSDVRAPALGPVRARRERSEPRRQHRPKVGYDVVRAASERRREERSDDRVIRFVLLARRVHLSSSWSWVRLHSPGSQRRADRPRLVSSWHRARRAMSRRRRVALVDGSERLG